jgi:hypothetical protein
MIAALRLRYCEATLDSKSDERRLEGVNVPWAEEIGFMV